MSKTLTAMLARGFDSDLSNKLISSGYTISKLKLKTLEELKQLGISEDNAENILKEARPAISPDILTKVLYESKWTCCVCRDNSKGIIVHHINEWSRTHDHSESNLVVLCLDDHDKAHTKKILSLNLTPDRLMEFKVRWLSDVKQSDTKLIKELQCEYSNWGYFNHVRIFNLFLKSEIDNTLFKTTSTLRNLNLINELGTFSLINHKRPQIYNFSDGYLLYAYMEELFNALLETMTIVDITGYYSRKYINSLVSPGTFIALQAAFYFKELTKNKSGKTQTRLCYYQKNNIKITFKFDAYETTSNSAWCSHLVGHKVVTFIGLVKSVLEKDGKLVIDVSCIALGTYFNVHPKKENSLFGSYDTDEYDELLFEEEIL